MATQHKAARLETGKLMAHNNAHHTDNCRHMVDLQLDRGLSNRLTIVLGPDADERRQVLSEWLGRRPYEVLLVDFPQDTDNPVCPKVILDAFAEAGIIDASSNEQAAEQACESRLIDLMNALASLKQDLVVILLNYRQGETTNKMLSFMLEHLPQQVHIYLCCDDTPDLTCIPRLRVRRQLQTVETGQN